MQDIRDRYWIVESSSMMTEFYSRRIRRDNPAYQFQLMASRDFLPPSGGQVIRLFITFLKLEFH
jgi:hypothetical protein